MNRYETYACCQVFHSYPDNKSFAEIIELCQNDSLRNSFNDSLEDTEAEDQQLCICEQYENESWEQIVCILEDFVRTSNIHFG